MGVFQFGELYIMCLLVDLGCDLIKLVGDGVCNDETNTANCNFDGGDCCLNVINKEYCSECTCFLKEFCGTGFHPLVGDGFCNEETNILECGYDGGDCCLASDLVGDGFCNDESNTPECIYDGGDCCFHVNTDLCLNCSCHCINLKLVGDGFCNDEANNIECNFDGGDCCGNCVIKEYCSKCECFEGTSGSNNINPLINDGFCNQEANSLECNFDSGHCCGPAVSCKGHCF